MTTMMKDLCNCYKRNKHVDNRLRVGLAVQLYKSKGVRSNPNNYHGITLLDIIGKIYCELINKRMTLYCEENGILSEFQNGFMRYRSGAHHLFCMLKSLKILKLRNEIARIFFLDYRKAFDTVHHVIMFNRLKSIGVPPDLIDIIRNLYDNLLVKVRVNEIEPDTFQIKAGLLQGDPLSPLMFAILIDPMISSSVIPW